MARYQERNLSDVHAYGIDLQENHIYLVGSEEYANALEGIDPGIEFVTANKFIKNINILTSESPAPILIHMKSSGGDWTEGLAIYDAIKTCQNKTCILNYAQATSMSSIIFQAADKRVMMPHSLFMFHAGSVAVEGTTKQFLTHAEQVKKEMEIMIDIYADSILRNKKQTKNAQNKIRKWLEFEMNKKEEVYLTATESVTLGFADEIFDGDKRNLLKF